MEANREKEQGVRTGPLLSDREFFLECLDLDYPGMEQVREHALEGDFQAARKAFAAYVRAYLRPDCFFGIPYEDPENIFRMPGESDAEAAARICGYTLISCGVPCAFGRSEAVDWEANPTSNGYKEWTWQLSRHNDIKLLAHEYRRTGDEWLAECAAKLLSSWLRQAVCPEACPGYLTKCWRTIECGIRMGANWPYILYSFYRSPAFTDELLVDWYKSVWEHGVRLSRDHMTGNWLIMEMNGLGQIGILYPQFKHAGAWLSQALRSLEEELDRQVYPDGFQYELTTNYHNVVVMNYQRFIQVAQAFGTPLPAGLTEKLARICEFEIKLMMPDGTTPDLNDGIRRPVLGWMQERKRILPEDRRIRWLTDGDAAGAPDFTSIALPWSGFAVFRTGWGREDAWALLDAGPFGRAHQHEDKLSVLFYAKGKLLLNEAGCYAYDDSEMRRYVLSTRAHNTVRVDGQDQNRRKHYAWKEEQIRECADFRWGFGKLWDWAEGNYGRLPGEGYGEEAAAGPLHSRRVFFYKKKRGNGTVLVLVDRLQAEKAHRWQALWHLDSTLTGETAGVVRFAEVDIGFSTGNAEVICGQTEPEWQGFTPTGTVQGMYREQPCVSVEAAGTRIRMVTVISPCTGESGRLARVVASENPDADGLSICFADGEELFFRESVLMGETVAGAE